MKIKAKHNQSLIDIAIQYTGSAETVFLILKENQPLELTDQLEPNQEINVPEEAIKAGNSLVIDYYAVNNIIPATALPYEEVIEEGILEDSEGWLVDSEGGIEG